MNKEQNLEQEFINFLGEKLGAKDQKDLEQKVKNLSKDQLEQYSKEFYEYKKKQAQKAAHGAKLTYLRKLKNICKEDEELIYYKKGGSLGCGCVKKTEEKQSKNKRNLEKGGKCPKCGKIHAAGMGCVVAKFKQKFEQGGRPLK